MQRYLLTRLAQSVVTLFAISIIIFFASRASVGRFFFILPPDYPGREVNYIVGPLGQNRSLPELYVGWLNDVAHGNLGRSLRGDRPVLELIGQRLPNSLKLGFVAMGTSLVLAFILGITAAMRPGTDWDNSVRLFAVLGQSTPPFLLCIIAINFFSVDLRLLPAAGMEGLDSYVLPAFSLGVFGIAGTIRLLRSSMIDALNTEFVKLARIKGVPEKLVVLKHALRNALMTVLTYAGIQFGDVITGALVVETVFAWPGLGRLAYEALMTRDFPVIQGTVLTVTGIYIIASLVVDILYAYVDPRVRHSLS